jgi:hypothetical protein
MRVLRPDQLQPLNRNEMFTRGFFCAPSLSIRSASAHVDIGLAGPGATRSCIVQARDQRGIDLLQRRLVLSIDSNQSYNDVYYTLEVSRSRAPLEVRLLELVDTPADLAFFLTHDLEQPTSFDDERLRRMGVPVQAVITFVHLLPGSRAAYSRSNFPDAESVAAWISPTSAKGQLAQNTLQYLRDNCAGFLSLQQESESLRLLDLLRVLNNVFWSVTPQLHNSFETDCTRSPGSVEEGYTSIRHLLGCERTATSTPTLRHAMS